MMTNRITTLRELDGLSVKDADRMPHPTLLSQWHDAGLYEIDADRGVFRLTPEGVRRTDVPSLRDILAGY